MWRLELNNRYQNEWYKFGEKKSPPSLLSFAVHELKQTIPRLEFFCTSVFLLIPPTVKRYDIRRSILGKIKKFNHFVPCPKNSWASESFFLFLQYRIFRTFFWLVFRGFLKREGHAKIGSPVLGYGDGIWNLLHPSTVHASFKSYGTNRMNHQSGWSWRKLKEESETYFIRYCFYSQTLSVMDPVYAPFSATQKRYATLLPRIGSLCQ